MKRISRYLPLLSLIPFCVPFAYGQAAIDLGVGFGGAWDSAGTKGVDLASSTGFCTAPYPTDITCQQTSKLSAFMLGFSGDVMIKPKLGFGIDYAITPARETYAPLNGATSAYATSTEYPIQARQSFYDFNAVFRPIQAKRAALNLEGGIGASRTSLSVTQTGCVGAACSSQTSPVGSVNHFQVHIGVGAEIFVTDHFFVRPQFDIHIASGLTDTWGSNFVPVAMVTVGWNLGSH